MSILIFSDHNDAHIPYVSKHLDTPPIVVGSQGLIDREELTYYADPTTSVVYKGRKLKGITSVWCRKPYWAAEQPPVPTMYKTYACQAMRWHVGALTTCFPEAFWLSNHFAIQRAAYKPLQLALARRLRFNVPESVFTSDAARAKTFLDSHTETIIKSPSSVYPVNEETKVGLALWARKVRKHESIDLTGLHLAPAIFQQAIDTTADIRVTVVGTKVFAANIMAKGVDEQYDHIRDWRITALSGRMEAEPFVLPKDIADKCVALVHELGLQFGAIDLVLDKRGKLWFLENNPNGQWAFVEEKTGQPIGKAIAELLVTGKS